ncbi:MAG: 1-(5-phosphoribosyl)-5-[(5-phosphoribosylamino)methylideneamino]imidazole-4-carboxamide isomerase [Phycisphaerales bacterium]|jgi:phosphoribosylformimino-5-aminoimidazole carboxamide ribotide isomerase|nr:1-(5-phosphoribosyl)-5-[(5-phosphoribosylamino)methylideneamino]imidazole-4-carboxamide isomerase [Phycisphaerales bacterium]
MSIEVIPSTDLRNGQVVRLQQGDYDRQIDYSADPIQTAQSFAGAGAIWMHIVDLDGAKLGQIAQADLIRKMIASSGLRVQVGGGVRGSSDIEKLLSIGAARVVVGTKALEDWAWFEQLIRRPDMDQKIVLAIDAREGVIATRGWTASSGRTAIEIAQLVRGWPLAGLLYTDVAKDGMLSGPNLEQTRKLAESTDVPVIASGGVGNLEHIRQLTQLPIWGAIVGRSLYEGKVNLPEALSIARVGG